MIIFAFNKAELKEKTQDANFSLQIKNPNPLLKNGFGFQNWADSGSRIYGYGLPTLLITHILSGFTVWFLFSLKFPKNKDLLLDKLRVN